HILLVAEESGFSLDLGPGKMHVEPVTRGRFALEPFPFGLADETQVVMSGVQDSRLRRGAHATREQDHCEPESNGIIQLHAIMMRGVSLPQSSDLREQSAWGAMIFTYHEL